MDHTASVIQRYQFIPAPDIYICQGPYEGVFIEGIFAHSYNQLRGVGASEYVVIDPPLYGSF